MVEDPGGAPLAGLRIRLEGGGASREATTDARGRAVIDHLRPGAYRLDVGGASAPGAEESLTLAPGRHHEGRLVFGAGNRERKRLALRSDHRDPGTAATGDALSDVPRASDPWSLLRDVPGVVVDRVDVGGSETGLQSLVLSAGDPGTGAVWTLDGADITDPAAVGSTSLYPDLDGLDAVQVRTSTLDTRARTPGVQIALFTRETGDRLTGRAHVRALGLQADNLPDALSGRPFFRSRTASGLDVGADAGRAIVPGRAWGWAGFGRDAVRQDTFTEHTERLSVSWFAAKSRLRFGTGTTTLLFLRSQKIDEDRDTTLTAARDARWRQSGPACLLSLDDRRTFGRVSVLAQGAWLDAGFRLEPQGGTAADAYEDFRGVFQGSYQSFETDRPRVQLKLEAAVAGRALGLDHRLALGTGYRRSQVETHAWWPGSEVLGYERQTVFFRTFRLTGFAQPTRELRARSLQDHAEAWAQDEVRRGRLSATVGVRFDRLAGRNLASSVDANPMFPRLLPAVSYGGAPRRFAWSDTLPRAGLAFDLSRDGASAVRLSHAVYAAPLGTADITFDNPIGRETAALTYYWIDRNGDHRITPDELDLSRGLLGASGVDTRAPAVASSPHRVEPTLRAPRTRELAASAEHTRGRHLRAEARVAWRRLDRALWRPLSGLTLADYVARGGVTGTLFDVPYDIAFFSPASTSRIVAGNGRVLSNRKGYHQETWTASLVASGRLGPRLSWEVWGSGTDWREFFDDAALSIQDPTPTEGDPLQDAGAVAVRPGGLGRGDLFVNARWTAGGGVRAGLPAAFEATLRVHAREGFPIPYFEVADTGDPTAPAKSVLVAPHVDSYRLPAVVMADARLARTFRVRGGRLTAALDVFNLLNRSTTLQVARDVDLPSFSRPREIVRPRILRLGLEYRLE